MYHTATSGEVKDRLKGTYTYGSEMYLTGNLHHHTHAEKIQHIHKPLRVVLMPASLPGKALGPEGPRCRSRMGRQVRRWEGGGVRGRDR